MTDNPCNDIDLPPSATETRKSLDQEVVESRVNILLLKKHEETLKASMRSVIFWQQQLSAATCTSRKMQCNAALASAIQHMEELV